MFKYKDNLGDWIELPELENGKIKAENLPPMDYVPTTRKINGETLDHDLTISGLPTVTSADNGKALTVQDGSWAAGTIIKYREV